MNIVMKMNNYLFYLCVQVGSMEMFFLQSTSRAGTAYPSCAHGFTSGFLRGLCCSIVSLLCGVL